MDSEDRAFEVLRCLVRLSTRPIALCFDQLESTSGLLGNAGAVTLFNAPMEIYQQIPACIVLMRQTQHWADLRKEIPQAALQRVRELPPLALPTGAQALQVDHPERIRPTRPGCDYRQFAVPRMPHPPMTDKTWTCPCCGLPGLTQAAYGGLANPPFSIPCAPPYRMCLGEPSYAVCDCCGYEFGNDDEPGGETPGVSFSDYLEEWINDGSEWFTPSLQPADWTLSAQLTKANIRRR